MDYHSHKISQVISVFGTTSNGLNEKIVQSNMQKYGENRISEKKAKPFYKRLLSALSEPMMLILLFSASITTTINVTKLIIGAETDFTECFGILLAVLLSVSISMIMEGSSARAFKALGKIYDNVYVKVIRDGTVKIISQRQVVVGDIIILSAGDKIVADGRLIESDFLSVNESALTGESSPIKKNENVVLSKETALAERTNMVYSGTYVVSGEGKMLVTAVGDSTEIGKIAGSLKDEKSVPSPLQQKLSSLGKKITLMGVISACIVFILSIIRMLISKNLTFYGVQNLFVSSIIMIVAAVPEGLPTIVAVSLALNMIKLAKENALIKKMIATETTGAVSVICSDKTGTLTLNKMSVEKVCGNGFCSGGDALKKDVILKNFVLNTTADVVKNKKEYVYQGSGTECALLVAYMKNVGLDYQKLRNSYKIIDRVPFSSKTKIMKTTVFDGKTKTEYVKGAPEIVLNECNITDVQRIRILGEIESYQKQAKRVLCFAHSNDGKEMTFDGYAVLSDKIRPEIKKTVKIFKEAGIRTIILTGDNSHTAYAVGVETGICDSPYSVVNASEIEKLTDAELKKILPKISVIARSTPAIKLRVVKALKDLKEVVAVTGDGINDAPAIKHADVGIAMGITGTEITKEASDVILLDDSFSTVAVAVAFGRNVYRNLQRFIVFQLSVNVSALLFITVCAVLGIPSPFNTLQLLWINVIMDGPPALTLGLEKAGEDLMKTKPIKRESGIINKKMGIKIAISAVYVAMVLILQYVFNFMCVPDSEKIGVVFTLFVVFQLFNAFNSRETGSKSVLKGIGKNKVMLYTFLLTFVLQILIITFLPSIFGVNKMSLISWVKTVGVASSIIAFSELYKWVYRLKRDKISLRKTKKTNKNKTECVN